MGALDNCKRCAIWAHRSGLSEERDCWNSFTIRLEWSLAMLIRRKPHTRLYFPCGLVTFVSSTDEYTLICDLIGNRLLKNCYFIVLELRRHCYEVSGWAANYMMQRCLWRWLLCRLWSSAQGENWWPHEPDKKGQMTIPEVFIRVGMGIYMRAH